MTATSGGDASTANDASGLTPSPDASSDEDAGVAESLEATVQGTKVVFDDKLEARLFTSVPELIVSGDQKSSGDRLVVRFPGAAATSSCAQGASVAYSTTQGLFVADNGTSGTDCTVTVTKSGQVGELVEGTFTTSAKKVVDGGAGPSLVSITGSFSVLRKPDT